MLLNILNQFKNRLTPTSKRTSWALHDLDIKVTAYLHHRGGFFVEAGANDGIRQSNTLYFETYLGWNGLLVEAIPALARKCLSNRPRCIVENCALVSHAFPLPNVDVHYRDLMSVVKGGIQDPEHEAQHLLRAEQFMKSDEHPVIVSVPARSLTSLLDNHRIPHIDLLSLDVEGYEMNVLDGLDFERYCPNYLLMEVRNRGRVLDVLDPWMEEVTIMHTTEDRHADILYRRRK